MEVRETNDFVKDQRNPYINAQEVNGYVGSLFETLREKAHGAEGHFKTEWVPVIKQWIEDLKDMMSLNIKAQIVTTFAKGELIGLCKLYKVPDSNGVAVYKEERNGKQYIYAAYLKDKELLPRETNTYIVIEAQSINDDIKELFSNSNLIVLV